MDLQGRTKKITSLVLFITFQIALSLSAQVLVPEPLLIEENFNQSLNARSIDIPVTSSLSKRHLSWLDAVARGTRLLCRLGNPDFLNDQSTVTSTDMLTRSGWVKSYSPFDPKLSQNLDPFFSQEGIVNNPSDLVCINWGNSLPSQNSLGQQVTATRGHFTNLYNAKAGLIIAYNNFGPAYMIRSSIKILPDVKAWSDVTFVEWQSQAQATGQDIKGLKYVIRYQVVNTDTLQIIDRAAGDEALIGWPGVTMPMSDEKGQALLGTPNGLGIAYLLATHKAQLGQKTVESVFVWTQMVAAEIYYHYAAFKIGPVSSSGPPMTAQGLT